MSQTFSIDTRLEVVADLTRAVCAACAALGLNEDGVMDVELAIAEAAANVVCHGYGGEAGGRLEASVSAQDDGVRIDLVDGGSPIPDGMLEAAAFRYPSDDLCSLPDSGRGLALIKASVDAWEYAPAPGANRLTLIKTL